jgi:hypothetical protein
VKLQILNNKLLSVLKYRPIFAHIFVSSMATLRSVCGSKVSREPVQFSRKSILALKVSTDTDCTAAVVMISGNKANTFHS